MKKIVRTPVLFALILSLCICSNIFALKASANENNNIQAEVPVHYGEIEGETKYLENDVLLWGESGGNSSNDDEGMPGWLIAVIVVCSVIIAGALAAIIIMARMYSKAKDDEEKPASINPEEFYELKQELEQLKNKNNESNSEETP